MVTKVKYNFFASLWKSVAPALLGVLTTGGIQAVFPHCSAYICTSAGFAVLLTTWGTLAHAAPPQGTPPGQ